MDKRPEFNDELLSAYLDGQLSPNERADVEARLADDADARDLVQELRAAAEAVRELPRVAAPRDLKAALLRAAEQIEAHESDGRVSTAASAGRAGGLSVGRSRRGWFWAALTVAAALMIMFLNRGDDVEPIVALNQGDGRDAVAVDDRRGATPRNGDETASPLGRARAMDRQERLEDANVDSLAVNDSGRPVELDVSRGIARSAQSLGESERRMSIADGVLQDGVMQDGALRADVGEVRQSVVDGASVAASGTVASNGPATSFDRYFKNVDATAAGGQDAGVVVSNIEVAFRDAAEVIQPDAHVYFVTVNVTPEAVRNNVVANSLGRNSITLVNQAEADVPGLAQLRAEEVEAVTVDSAQESQWGRQQLARPNPTVGQPTNASGVIAVEALPEQVAGFLNDMANDPQNFTAVAVLAEAGAPEDEVVEQVLVERLEEVAKYNRNADKAIGQVAGNWRFEPTGQTAEPVRVQRFLYTLPAEDAAVVFDVADSRGGIAGGGEAGELDGTNGREASRRFAGGREDGAEQANTGGFGGGIGGGGVDDSKVDESGTGRGGVRSRANEASATADAPATEEKGPGADTDLAALPTVTDAYGATGSRVGETPAQEAAPAGSAETLSLGLKEGLKEETDESGGNVVDFADESEFVLAGKAWFISPLQFRGTAIADQSQQLAQTAESFGLEATTTQAGAARPASGEGEARLSRELSSRGDAETSNNVEELALQSGANVKDRAVDALDATAEFGDRAGAGRQAATEPAAEPPPAAATRAVTLDDAIAHSHAVPRDEQAQLAAKVPAAAPARKPVRVVLFFNVLPVQPQPAAAAPAAAGEANPTNN